MSLRAGETRPCEACGERIVGALTRDGKVAPVCVEPDPMGNVLLFRATAPGSAEPVLNARTFGGFGLDDLRGQGVPLRLNHFASCPEADRFRPK